MDKIDRKIINLLQKNARASLKELSKECFISSPAIAARINKLERNGIITGYHTSVNMEKINFHVKAFIQVQLEPRQKQEFYPYIQQIPNVIECNCVTGDYSEIMEVVFPSIKAKVSTFPIFAFMFIIRLQHQLLLVSFLFRNYLNMHYIFPGQGHLQIHQ